MSDCLHERTPHSADDGSEILKPLKPKRRKGVHKISLKRLEERIDQTPKQYEATNDDLPISFWEEPEL